MKHLRYDRHEIKAQFNEDGHLYDTPVITRTGVFAYRNPDGSTRRELRLPEEVFKQDSLETLRGIPITLGHVGKAGSSNTHGNIGAVLSAGKQDGDNLIADIVIHKSNVINQDNQELSCGYECDLEEKSGVWNGQAYDVIQRNIRHNHLAIVKKGRAGVARLNLDAADEDFDPITQEINNPKPKEINMTKIRLDNGIEYDAEPEVAAELNKIRVENADLIKAKDTAEAERDVAKANLKELQDKQAQIQTEAIAEAKARLELENQAKAAGVEVKQDSSDREIKIAVISKIRQDMNFDGKSDDYVQGFYDDACVQLSKSERNAQSQRNQITQNRQDGQDSSNPNSGRISAAEAREKMLQGFHNSSK